MKLILSIVVLLLVTILPGANLLFAQCMSDDPSSPVGIVPDSVSGNPTLCTGGFRVDPPDPGTYVLDAFGNTVTVVISSGPCGEIFSWTASENIVMDRVVAKGGNGANIYDYSGEDPRPAGDGNLHSPTNSSGGYADLSHIDFCYHYRLTGEKTATTEYTRTFEWALTKSCDGPSELTLSPGQIYNYPFSWTASVTSSTDSDWKVTGTITITNNTPFTATITSLVDELSGGVPATVDCGIAFPYDLASGDTLECTYTADLGGAFDGTNTVTVETSTPDVEGTTATADYAFGDPTSLIDECVNVEDYCAGRFSACADDEPFTHEYTCPIGPYDECGEYTYKNVVTSKTCDRSIILSDSCTVLVEVPCAGGCTLTPGYWKTHSEFGPAPYDATWASLPNGASTIFFLSGKSYYDVLWMSVGGNAYYILAHAYIAAALNQLNGADLSAVQGAFNTATTLFNTYTPAQIGALKGSSALRKQFVDLGATLDNYNNGLTGPGHCDEGTNKLVAPGQDQGSNLPEETLEIPSEFRLGQNYPNPFNPVTTITYQLPVDAHVTLSVVDVMGRVVATLVDGPQSAGSWSVALDGSSLASGVYFYRLQADTFVETRKLMLMK